MSKIHFLHPTRLRVVILESPYDSLNEDRAPEIFGKIAALKLKGYGHEYPYGIMPVDTTDFICTHLAVFRQSANDFLPIMAYKSVQERKCRLHKVAFSGIHVPASSGAEKNVRAVQKLIEESDRAGSVVAYGGGWTIDPEARKDRALVNELKNLFTLMQVKHHLEFENFDSLCCGHLRFKTERLFYSWGYSPLKLDGQELPPFQQTSLNKENALMLHARQFSKEALETARQYDEFWQNRLLIGKTPAPIEEAARKKAA